jgi:hypothetical protein
MAQNDDGDRSLRAITIRLRTGRGRVLDGHSFRDGREWRACAFYLAVGLTRGRRQRRLVDSSQAARSPEQHLRGRNELNQEPVILPEDNKQAHGLC